MAAEGSAVTAKVAAVAASSKALDLMNFPDRVNSSMKEREEKEREEAREVYRQRVLEV